ncbi:MULTISPECIES: DUF4873 domain-containing protein [unclassified Saccharopolyspora]|uniref:DUF4873 domain-containing protein n=1 Tax=unclassified Saccharopolyspora TaxID=2646250 RepID=UPI001CD7AC45|nr:MULTISPECIES: DUF4873 domain-containing protein [unclassified Saccharopolyspora]MCA1185495.1 DUF4873 domain-containing protein [Saccharopolyspora sp. 6T]MCA1192282.1 DUF4873 domain-containing protein [Saccharopolyspora sp. 6V]MCA1225164.1 DUF4873 domain-containing protein [Saccharopolyspora sp. 6M]MCA1279597.1 DUF4873 domain-containing protein [Saccharopolyspora sp. 7B]
MSEETTVDAGPDEEYEGEAVLFTAEREVPVSVVLRGHFQPIDGRFHWYGRVAADDAVAELAAGRRTEVVVRTTRGEAAGSLSEPDPWHRYRITGVGRPPF